MKRLLILAAIPLVLLLQGCSVQILNRWPDSTPQQVRIRDGEHVDEAPSGPYDLACITQGPPSPCQEFGWAEPMNVYWEHITIRECFGVQGFCNWETTDDHWEHHWCGKYWPSWECVNVLYPRAGFPWYP